MSFLSKEKTNFGYLSVVIILAAIAGAIILLYPRYLNDQEGQGTVYEQLNGHTAGQLP